MQLQIDSLFLHLEMVWVCIDWADVQVTLFGEEGVFDNEFNKQDCLITLSHRGDFDWLVGLVFCYYKNFLHVSSTNIIVKFYTNCNFFTIFV